MQLTYPMMKSHNFRAHVRSPEVRRAIVRHTQVAAEKNGTAESIENIILQPNTLPLFAFFNEPQFPTVSNVELAPQALSIRLFLRLKLGSFSAGGEDPLL